MLRNLYFSQEEKGWVELNHAHNQLLDITWIEIVFVIIYSRVSYGLSPNGFALLLPVAILSVFGSVIVDIRQHSIERYLMLRKGREALIDWLRSAGMIPG